MRRFLLTLTLVFLPFLLSAEPEPIKIGVIHSLTGAAEEDGQNMLRAIRMAVDHANQNPDFPKIELLIEDDGSIPARTISAYQKLKTQKVDLIMGPSWSFLVNSLAPLAGRDQVVVFNTSNFPELLNFREAKGFLFTNSFSLKVDAESFRRFIRKLKDRDITIVRNPSPWSTTQVGVYSEIIKQEGGKIIQEIEAPAIENNDWRNLLPKIKQLNPAIVVLFLGRNDVEVFLRRSAELGFKPKFFGGAHSFDSFIRTNEKSIFDGLCFPYPLKQLTNSPQFYTEFQARYHEQPRLYADTSYDAVFLLIKAVSQARKTGMGLRETLKQTQYSGIVGNYSYSEQTSFANGKTSVVCVDEYELQLR